MSEQTAHTFIDALHALEDRRDAEALTNLYAPDAKLGNVITGQDRAALEWTTTGAGPDGKPFTYTGVTVLEIKDDKITRSCAYFDPSALGRQIEPQT